MIETDKIKFKVIVLGPIPPPYMGPSVATEIILNSKLKDLFQLIHLDTSDHRELSFLNKIDLKNIILAIKQYFLLIFLILSKWPKIVYIPISQTTIGYIRDSGFVLIAKLFKRKVVCHLRGGNFWNWYSNTKAITRLYVRFIHWFVDGQIVLGEILRSLFTGIIPQNKIFVVPNGRNYDDAFKKISDRTRIKVLYLANFIPSKGVLETLKSVPAIINKNKNVEFIFAGNKGHENIEREIKSFIDLHSDILITIKGQVLGQEKYDLLSASDIFVFPTYYPPEGHPWVIVEAMAAGLPIISTDQGAIIESVIDGFNGFIVDKRNSEQIAEKVTLLINDNELRERMGKNSRKIYEEKFTEEKMVANLANCFNQVLNVYDVERWYSDLSDKWWKNYASGDTKFDRRLKSVHSLLDAQRNYSRILDVGCGTGEITASVGERFKVETTGIDISAKMVEYCNSKNKDSNLNYLEGNILELNLPDSHFDLVLSLSVIEWIADVEKAIKEVAHVLKPGGQWIVSIPNWRSPFRKLEYLCSLFVKRSYIRYQRNRVPIIKFVKTVEKYGLVLEKTNYHVLPIFNIQIIGKIGAWLHMMCMMSFKKVSNLHEATNPKT